MKYFVRLKVIIWILAGSLIITLSILISMIYHTQAEPDEFIGGTNCSASCMMLFEELELDATQHEELENILHQFKDTSAVLVSMLRQRRLDLMEELHKDITDSIQISFLSEELGAIQVRMTKQAACQYLRIRAICEPDQRQKLSNVYCDMFGCGRINMGKGQGQHRYRNGRK